MLKKNEIIIETTNYNLAKELMNTCHDDITIHIYQTRAFPAEEVAKIIISFIRDAGLVYFGHWLSSRQPKNGFDTTTINKKKIPYSSEEITALIKQELKNIQTEQEQKEKQ